MLVAGLMLAHQVASKAVRDAAFLAAWPAEALPAMVIATAVAVVLAVPLYARLLSRFGPRVVVPAGFLLSAVAHAVEWRLSSRNPWVAAAIYLHVAGLGAMLLSGFWSLVSELFDPKSAKASYGRIAAAGTIGGLLGGLSAARAATLSADAALLLLAGLHALCAAGVLWLGRAAITPVAVAADRSARLFDVGALRAAPHVRMLALIVVLSSAGAAIVDYLLKSNAQLVYRHGELLRFFAVFYTVVQIAAFLAQAGVAYIVRRFGLGRTISSLPLGLGISGVAAFFFPGFPMFVAMRGVESVLRASMFRSGYELLFVPMDPAEKRRTKTFLDVTCDRAGDAIGASVVQVLLLAGTAAILTRELQLLAITIVLAAAGIWLGRRLDVLYLGVIERRLVTHAERTPIVVGSEMGWTILEVATPVKVRPAAPRAAAPAAPAPPEDPRLRALAELRSGDRRRVEDALDRLVKPDAMLIAQVIQLLAWDDVVSRARKVLEAAAAFHVGLLVDALVDADTDFAIRRRLPRVLGTLSSDLALRGLLQGLDDARFEVRYQCSHSIDRMLSRSTGLAVDPARVMAVVDRELSVSPQVWQGYRLIDRAEGDAVPATQEAQAERAQENVTHVFCLLAAVLPREPLQVAFRGIRADDPSLRGLALEYLDGVLPPAIRAKLYALLNL
jgi:AAA family ATP:ADP antiporter